MLGVWRACVVQLESKACLVKRCVVEEETICLGGAEFGFGLRAAAVGAR